MLKSLVLLQLLHYLTLAAECGRSLSPPLSAGRWKGRLCDLLARRIITG